VPWGRPEQFDGVLGGGAAGCGGSDRRRVRETPFVRGFARVSREMLESGWRGDLQNPQRLVASDEEPVPVASRPWFRPVWDAPTQDAVLGAYAKGCTLIGGRAAQSFEAVRGAADTSPEVNE
jgi:hypothetical protein